MTQQFPNGEGDLEEGDRALRLVIATGLILTVFDGAPENGEIFTLALMHIYLVTTALIGIDPLYRLIPLCRRFLPEPVTPSRIGQHA